MTAEDAAHQPASGIDAFRLCFEHSPIGMAMADLEYRFTVVNQAMCAIIGRSAEDLRGRSLDEFSHPLDRGQTSAGTPMSGALPAYQREARILRSDGETRWIQHDVSPVLAPDGPMECVLVQAQDITERKANEEKLLHQALHDPLTGLPNRLLLVDRLRQALARRGRGPGRVVALFLDVDRFKSVNDRLGHAAGDELLVQIAARLSTALRAGDTLSRLGGDEFVIVYDDVSPADASHLGNRLASVMKQPFDLDGQSVHVGASIGMTVATPEDDAVSMLRNADAAMYEAKRSGRGRLVAFEDVRRRDTSARTDTEGGLRRALEGGGLEVHVQPIVDVATARPVDLEALVRWVHPTEGLVHPAQFIQVAEDSGLIVPIGEWVLREALSMVHQYRTGLAGRGDLGVAVNLSARQLRAPDLIGTVETAISASGLPAEAVVLEITEALVMNDLDLSIETLYALRGLGVRLAIDDFGTGHSSLGYLKRLPVSILKVDRSLIRGLDGDDPHDASIVTAIVGLAHGLGLHVVAEGVETPGQRDRLRQMGPVLAQGHLWCRPLARDDAAEWLARSSPGEP